jgi:N-acetylmuramoyl-L-alanine amidase
LPRYFYLGRNQDCFMFNRIIEFLRKFFQSISGDPTPPPPPENPPTPTPDPGEEPSIPPEDGSEVDPDTVVVDIPVIDEDVVTDPPPPVDPPPPSDHQPRFLWCLDNGHGKLTAGKRSPVFDDGETQLFEYEFNRDVVQRIATLLTEKGVQFFEVVPEVDNVGNFLEERVNRANQLASVLPKLFVSIHSNAAPAPFGQWSAPSISGIETWHYHTSRNGKAMAKIFQQQLIKEMGWKNRGLKSRPDGQFYVLRKTTMPAVLTENGFYNNKQQAAELMRPEIRQRIAEAHVAAIMEIERDGLKPE